MHPKGLMFQKKILRKFYIQCWPGSRETQCVGVPRSLLAAADAAWLGMPHTQAAHHLLHAAHCPSNPHSVPPCSSRSSRDWPPAVRAPPLLALLALPPLLAPSRVTFSRVSSQPLHPSWFPPLPPLSAIWSLGSFQSQLFRFRIEMSDLPGKFVCPNQPPLLR